MSSTTQSTARQRVAQLAREAFVKADYKGILDICMRVGKTKIAIDIITSLIDKNLYKVLILYPDNKIGESWRQQIKTWSSWDKDNKVHITMYNYSSIEKAIDLDWDFVVFDEIHATSDRQRIHMDTIISKTSKVIGLSGTVSEGTKEDLAGLDMHVIYRYSMDEAISDGIVAPYEIKVHVVALDDVIKTKNKSGKYKTEKQQYDAYTFVINKLLEERKDVKFLFLNRNRLLQNSIAKFKKTKELLDELHGERVLVFAGLKAIAEKLGIAYHHSTSNNPEVFQKFVDGFINKIAVVNIGKAGITFSDLQYMIINSFTGNEETTEQIISRALNKEYDGKIGVIHIICSSEEAELRKLSKTLARLNSENIEYV